MRFQTKIVIFIIGTCSLIALTNADAACKLQNCFDCNRCNKDCTKFTQNCDSDCLVEVRQFLCKMENDNCRKANGCDVPPVGITIYPAINYDESRPVWKSETIQARNNCCYKLSGLYDNTLTGLKINGACVILYDGSNCNGAHVKVDSSWSQDCLKWIDCPTRVKGGGIKFNDKASSFRLC